MLPFYRKLEHDADLGGDVHGKGGPIWIERPKSSNWHPIVSAFYAPCREMGFGDAPDFNDPESTGVGPCASNVREGNPRLDRNRLSGAGAQSLEPDYSWWMPGGARRN